MSTLEAITVKRGFNGITKVDMEDYFDDAELDSLYRWIDRIPLSTAKKNFANDFADGVLVAEIVRHYFPKWVDVHNYDKATSSSKRKENWYRLNRKVLKRLRIDLSDDVIAQLSNAKLKTTQKVLMLLRDQIDSTMERLGMTPGTYASPRISPRPRDDMPQFSPKKTRNATDLPMLPAFKTAELPHSHPDRRTYLGNHSVKSYTLPPISDSVPRAILEEKQMECDAKEETINILHSKVRRLEHLLNLKDTRLEDLENRLLQIQSLGKINKI